MDDPFEALTAAHPDWGPATLQAYAAWWRRWRQFLEVPWDQVERRHVEQFQRQQLWSPSRTGRLRTANTIDQALRFLRHFYTWAQSAHRIRMNPMDGWVLPRPPQPARHPLTAGEFLRLCNAPDLATAIGLADLVLLHLLYQGVSTWSCSLMTIDEIEELPDDQALHQALAAYLERGRPRVLRDRSPLLFLSATGRPFPSGSALAQRLHRYEPVLNRKITARLLSQSRQAHIAEAWQRHRTD